MSTQPMTIAEQVREGMVLDLEPVLNWLISENMGEHIRQTDLMVAESEGALVEEVTMDYAVKTVTIYNDIMNVEVPMDMEIPVLN